MSTVVSLRQLPLHRYAVRGATLAVSQLGATGDAVLFVPGYTGGKEDFLAIADGVVGHGFHYLAMDQRGQNESTGPDDGSAHTIEALAGDLRELLALIGAPVHLVGHSFGGLVARQAVIDDPSTVRSLTLMSSGPGALTGPRAEAIVALEPVLLAQGQAAVYDAIEDAALRSGQREAATTDIAAFMRRRFLAASVAGLAAMGRELLVAPDLVEELRASGVPMLVVHGTEDDTWSPQLQTDMAGRLGAQHRVIAGAAHSPAAERPAETVVALADFWRSIA